MGASTSSLSGSISFDGLGSGTKFDPMISELKKLEEIPKNRLIAWKADWKTRFDAFDALYKNVQSLATSFKGMGTMDTLLQKKVSSSTSGIASATAGASALNTSHTFEVKKLATNAVVTNKTLFTKEDKVTEAGQAGVFAYAYKGEPYQIDVAADSTIEDLVKRINSDSNNPGVTASLIKSGKQYMFQLQGNDTGAESELYVTGGTTLPKFSSTETFALSGSLGPEGPGTGRNTVLNADADPSYFSFYFSNPQNGNLQCLSLEVAQGDTMAKLAQSINDSSGVTGVKATIQTIDGEDHLYLASDNGKPIEIKDGLKQGPDGEMVQGKPVTPPGLLAANTTYAVTQWTERKAQDAEYTVDGINDVLLHSDTNKLTDVFEGLTVTLEGEGKTVLTTTTSTENLKTKIQEMVKGLNDILGKIKELTKVDENKTLTDRTQEKNQYASQFSSQYGSTLTGNYGVQMLTTQLKSAITGQATGFRGQNKTDDTFGDLFTSLSSIGIVVDSDEASSTYGQLRFLTEDDTKITVKDSDIGVDGAKPTDTTTVTLYRTLDQALKEDPKAVAELLAGDDVKVDSSDFSFSNYISGITKPGNYKVEYDVVDGKPANVMIGGIAAHLESDNGRVYVVDSGPASGLAISIDNLTDGSYSGAVRVRQGKIAQLSNFFSDQLAMDPIKPGEDGTFNKDIKRGALVILKDNYQDIMESIDAKIDKETKRVDRWEKQQRLRFARLDTLLGSYNNQMTKNAASLKSLEGGSSE